jgi:hypothetical protein
MDFGIPYSLWDVPGNTAGPALSLANPEAFVELFGWLDEFIEESVRAVLVGESHLFSHTLFPVATTGFCYNKTNRYIT